MKKGCWARTALGSAGHLAGNPTASSRRQTDLVQRWILRRWLLIRDEKGLDGSEYGYAGEQSWYSSQPHVPQGHLTCRRCCRRAWTGHCSEWQCTRLEGPKRHLVRSDYVPRSHAHIYLSKCQNIHSADRKVLLTFTGCEDPRAIVGGSSNDILSCWAPSQIVYLHSSATAQQVSNDAY